MIVVGIDPGKSGYVAAFDTNSDQARVQKLVYDDDVLDWRVVHRMFRAPPDIIVVEKLIDGARSQQTSKFSAFQMGMYYGQLRMALKASNWQYRLVAARTWQASIHLQKKDGTAKERTLETYKSMYPHLPIQPGRNGNYNDNAIDAWMITTYAVMMEGLKVRPWRLPVKRRRG